MKRTCLQENTTCPDLSGNTDEQITCEPALPSGRFHRLNMWIKETKYNRQLISDFNNLQR